MSDEQQSATMMVGDFASEAVARDSAANAPLQRVAPGSASAIAISADVRTAITPTDRPHHTENPGSAPRLVRV